jgi:hypothetical protein
MTTRLPDARDHTQDTAWPTGEDSNPAVPPQVGRMSGPLPLALASSLAYGSADFLGGPQPAACTSCAW